MLKTFRIGGIHPPENKLSSLQSIVDLDIPAQVVIPLSQHIGTPARPVVTKGDKVKTGTIIAKPEGFVSAGIHSSVSGTVLKIDEAIDQSGYKRPAIYIDTEGDEWEETIDRTDILKEECKLTAKEILDKIREAGIVGMGGATFPTHVKLTPPPGFKADTLIINAAECEPYLTADHRLMLEKGEEILVGISLLMKASDTRKALIGIENNKKDAIEHLSRLAKKYPDITVCRLKTRYPQGGEKQLIDALIKRRIPGGSLPVSAGAIVQNVSTAFAVYEAVQKNKPLIERIVTVTGKNIKLPSNLRVRVGAPVQALIDSAGGMPEGTGKIIAGGPMMGKALTSTSVPVGKGTSGILLIPASEAQRRERRDCIRCAQCVSVCPMHLEPYLLMTVVEFSQWEQADNRRITDCIECGSCSYTCPSDRPLLDYIRMGKAKVSKNTGNNKKS